MRFISVTSNGDFPLAINGLSTNSQEVTVYAPTIMGGTVVIGYINGDGVTEPYTEGAMFAGEQKRIRCGIGVNVQLTVSGFTAAFKIGIAG